MKPALALFLLLATAANAQDKPPKKQPGTAGSVPERDYTVYLREQLQAVDKPQTIKRLSPSDRELAIVGTLGELKEKQESLKQQIIDSKESTNKLIEATNKGVDHLVALQEAAIGVMIAMFAGAFGVAIAFWQKLIRVEERLKSLYEGLGESYKR